MTRWIFLDLDGPLLDVSERYHRLHSDLVLTRGGQPLDREAYWLAKRDRIPETEILIRTGLAPGVAAEAAATRLGEIESRDYLRLDRPWPWTSLMLRSLAELAPLVLVTARRYPNLVAWQLDQLGLRGHFARVVAGRGDETLEAKAQLLRTAGFSAVAGSVIVGDTEMDLASGRSLGLITVALKCGIRSTALLMAWAPDLLLDDLRQVPNGLRSLGWPLEKPS